MIEVLIYSPYFWIAVYISGVFLVAIVGGIVDAKYASKANEDTIRITCIFSYITLLLLIIYIVSIVPVKLYNRVYDKFCK